MGVLKIIFVTSNSWILVYRLQNKSISQFPYVHKLFIEKSKQLKERAFGPYLTQIYCTMYQTLLLDYMYNSDHHCFYICMIFKINGAAIYAWPICSFFIETRA